MRIIFFLLLTFLLAQPVLSQEPTKKEMQAQMLQDITDLKKQIVDLEKDIVTAKANKDDEETIKEMEKELVQLKQQLATMENLSNTLSKIPASSLSKASEDNKDEGPSGIPPKKTALLATLPKDNLSKTELVVFLTTLQSDLRKKTSPERLADVQKIISQLDNEATQIAYSGVAAWYSNAPVQAALLSIYAASKSPGNYNTLNNCGAILNLCGQEHKAIPILNYVLVKYPDNSTVLNNLGQAYAGLGDTSKAMMYLRRCIKESPEHPEANATAAIIEESNGNMDKALEYTEQSLKGAYSEERADFFGRKKKSCKVKVVFDTKRFSKTQFFDPGSLRIPSNCRDWGQCETVYPEQVDFNEMVETLMKKYENIVLQNQVGMNEIRTMGKSPFEKAAMFKKTVIGDCYLERKNELVEELLQKTQTLTGVLLVEDIALSNKYDAECKACPEIGKAACLDRLAYKYCLDRKTFDNKKFSLLADISDEHTKKNYTEDVGYYNSLVYLEAISSVNDKVLAATCGAYAVVFVGGFPTYVLSSECNPSNKPKCEQLNPANKQNPSSPNFNVAQCPINIKVSFGAGKVSLSCKSFGIEIGQGVKFGYEKNFITKESTLSMGVGVDADIPGILDAKAKEKLYVKFDKDNQPIDVGLATEVSVGIKGMPPIASAGYTLGVNSGLNFSGHSPF